jgi:hypothetical protein
MAAVSVFPSAMAEHRHGRPSVKLPWPRLAEGMAWHGKA